MHFEPGGAMSNVKSRDARRASELLFKEDRPRTIDRYIDFFGGSGRPDEPVPACAFGDEPDR
jgi:hypothetical protein